MHTMDDLLRIMATLRDPACGCPWDLEQDFATIAPYTIEEAYEVVDAIDRCDFTALRDELGDLLLQVLFHAQMAKEAEHFDFADVVDAIASKMIRRHPHVFGGSEVVADAETQTRVWDEHKRAEREAKGEIDTSALAGIAQGLPEWQRALKLQKRAAMVGFDWLSVEPVLAKLDEEIGEVRAEFARGDTERLADEVGDLLFVCVNLARHAKVDVSQALRRANTKFERRFRRMEWLASEDGGRLADRPLAAQEMLWERAKAEEKK